MQPQLIFSVRILSRTVRYRLRTVRYLFSTAVARLRMLNRGIPKSSLFYWRIPAK